MKKIVGLLLTASIMTSYATLWNTPDYHQNQTQTIVVKERPGQTVIVKREYYPRNGYYSRPVRAAVEGAVNTADTAVESAANVVRSIFN